MKVAIVGSGISGLVVAHHLQRHAEVDVYEAADWIGGHTHTVEVRAAGRDYAVDTGFIVHNDRNYPEFCRLLSKLGVATRDTEMSFGLTSERSGTEYSGGSANGLFAQRANLFRPGFWRMVGDIRRFFREAPRVLDAPDEKRTLGEYLEQNRYSAAFCDEHLLPMAAAIWSAELASVRDFPVQTFVRFFQNHGLLTLSDRPQWRVICGGSQRYVDALTAPFRERVRLNTPVRTLRRLPDGRGVELETRAGERRTYDRVVVATHSDQGLALLEHPTRAERAVLSSIAYQPNEVVLHTDESVLPRSRRAWAAWNYRVPKAEGALPIVTYDMNLLQGIDAPVRFLVTLNHGAAIDPARVLRRFEYAHPLFDGRAIAAQAERSAISGVDRIHFAGAYWANGFHEDGVKSALQVVGELLP